MKGLEIEGVDVIGLTPKLSLGSELIDNKLNILFTERPRWGTFAYISDIKQRLKEAGDVDLYHIHGTWMYHGLAVSKYAVMHEKPYVVAPRGMLYPQALTHHSMLKKMLMACYQHRIFNQASCVQATCMEEMRHYRHLGFQNPVAVLPNPIVVKGIVERPIPVKSTFQIGYLGRVHPRKRIERLIYAFHQQRQRLKDCQLVIIGGGDDNYLAFLKTETRRLKLDNVTFTGFLTGREKDEAILNLSLLVVPSDFENFGNIVTEALVRGVPVAASKGTPWQELSQNGCGWWMDNDQESINDVLCEAVSLPRETIMQMGNNGKQLMKDNYSVEVLGQKMLSLYKWLLHQSDKPDFVYI
jgi:glycosyltransferase involved in cell wall biosynthesis